ncbi:Crp/Fnr family transcriptional regulator [Galbibacter sp. EGI 63066]|uniref:Crp/Fnr family transcriptional regulator n=1 Tax=Galbibacter sp. EGI 63066 TaxID=2993559 RepID=UPI0022494867|nr:Crp/Fnr family transcriptional regulator [Galbibacter sp. EGI 63066]MCX2681203.1 Crp/Fnr family transcriptional regulator [Galbibacter sp. EGI 63066]
MFSAFLDILSDLSPLSDKSRNALLKHLSSKRIPKDSFILKHGEVCKHIYFIHKGFARTFYYKNGKEITEWFADEKGFSFSITSYFQEQPSKLVIECLEDSEVIYLPKKEMYELSYNHIDIAQLIIKMFSYSLMISQERMDSIQFETAKQRYDKLLKNQPEILQKVPLQYIASYLGITSETLSRIRN